MAKVTDVRPAEPVYDAALRWRKECLDADGSLFTPGKPVWTSAALDELENCFVLQPDTGKGSYLEKLHKQLGDVSDTAVQLMAELHAVHFLMWWTEGSGAISPGVKRSQLATILSWRDGLPSVPKDIDDAMGTGIARMGQWALSRRDTQVNYLIEFSRAWKGLPSEERTRLGEDPWALLAFSKTIDVASAESQRAAVMHLLHPDTFEPMVSGKHKELVIERYKALAEGQTDPDRALLAIRKNLEPSLGAGFHFYLDPIVNTWQKKLDKWKPLCRWVTAMKDLPGFDAAEVDFKLEAGKGLADVRAAVLAGDDWFPSLKRSFSGHSMVDFYSADTFLGWVDAHRDHARSALLALWEVGDQGPVQRVQAFLAAMPEDAIKAPGARLNIASFLLLGVDAAANPLYKPSSVKQAFGLAGWDLPPKEPEHEMYRSFVALCDELVHDCSTLRHRLDAQGALWALTKYDWTGNDDEKPAGWSVGQWHDFLAYLGLEPVVVHDEAGGGAGGTSVDTPEASYSLGAAADATHIDAAFLETIVDLLRDKRQVVFYGPPGTGKTWLALHLAEAIARGDPSRTDLVQFHPAMSYEDFIEGLRPEVTAADQVIYRPHDGQLLRFVEKAVADPGHRYVMVIDEINRANLPRVFGELLFLLEYRDRSVRRLYRPDETFRLPENLWFIGTMNTADRSIALIDAAMRRRFHFVPFFPHLDPVDRVLPRWLDTNGEPPNVGEFLAAVNKELMAEVGEHLLIGPSHFMKKGLCGDEKALERIWTYNVFPLIEEMFWGQATQVDRWRWNSVRTRFAAQLGFAPAGDESAGEVVSEDDEAVEAFGASTSAFDE